MNELWCLDFDFLFSFLRLTAAVATTTTTCGMEIAIGFCVFFSLPPFLLFLPLILLLTCQGFGLWILGFRVRKPMVIPLILLIPYSFFLSFRQTVPTTTPTQDTNWFSRCISFFPLPLPSFHLSISHLPYRQYFCPIDSDFSCTRQERKDELASQYNSSPQSSSPIMSDEYSGPFAFTSGYSGVQVYKIPKNLDA
ncbi:hypothetical protein IWX49DRAFT_579378 [Phyllosticta citricarpa]|uniref:Uncharacterized protein n=2 Tax=Phyllosticta TaxID=121621 RepID=A0ABR1MIA2_9PEZI